MPTITSTIRRAPGGDGPLYVVTEKDGVVTNVTLTVANIGAALDQCKSDAAVILAGPPVITAEIVTISTTAN